MRLILSLLCVALMSGCATIITGSNQAITIETDPVGAACTVARSGEKLAAIGASPGQVTITKSVSPLDIECKKAAYRAAKTSIEASFQPWFVGNILLGGLIGMIVDMVTGAGSEYPVFAKLTLVPSSFSSSGDRDAFFERKRAEMEDEAAGELAAAKIKCRGDSLCEAQLSLIEEKKKKRAAELEAQRSVAVVPPSVDAAGRSTGEAAVRPAESRDEGVPLRILR